MIWRGMKILSIFWGGGKQNWTGFGGHFYAILGPVLNSMYKIQNGDSLRMLKFHFYLSIYF